jgi:hypothetical protein
MTAMDWPRVTVFCGTINPDRFLGNSEGNRRFWPIRVGSMIDLEWVKANRDQIWAEAYHYLQQGGIWHLTPEQEAELRRAAQRYMVEDVRASILVRRARHLIQHEQRKGISREEAIHTLWPDTQHEAAPDAQRQAVVDGILRSWRGDRAEEEWNPRERIVIEGKVRRCHVYVPPEPDKDDDTAEVPVSDAYDPDN